MNSNANGYRCSASLDREVTFFLRLAWSGKEVAGARRLHLSRYLSSSQLASLAQCPTRSFAQWGRECVHAVR